MPTVLIADDEKNILQLARMYLQAEGFTEIIHKPFEVEAFLSRIEQLATLHRTAGA